MALTQPNPANPRRQALERDALLRHVEPAMQMRVVRDELFHLRVGLGDVIRIAGERGPAERPNAAAEERTHISRHKTRIRERILDALILRDLANVVAVIDNRHALLVPLQHGPHMHRHRSARRFRDSFRILRARLHPTLNAPTGRQITVHWIVR